MVKANRSPAFSNGPVKMSAGVFEYGRGREGRRGEGREEQWNLRKGGQSGVLC